MDNITDIIEDGIDGKLFTPEDPESLVQAIAALLESDAERHLLGIRARVKVETCRNWEAIAGEILAAVSGFMNSIGICGTGCPASLACAA